MHRTGLIILTALLLMAALSGCGQSKSADAINPPDYADAMAEQMLQSFNSGDYATYSEDFNETMRQTTPESVFLETRTFVQNRIGAYKSKELSDVQVDSVDSTVVYKAKFSEEKEDVKVTIVFQANADNVSVSGFWLESPKLWEH